MEPITLLIVIGILYMWNKKKKEPVKNNEPLQTGTVIDAGGVSVHSDANGISTLPNITLVDSHISILEKLYYEGVIPTELIPTGKLSSEESEIFFQNLVRLRIIDSNGLPINQTDNYVGNDAIMVPYNTPTGEDMSNKNPFAAITGGSAITGKINQSYPVPTSVTLSWGDVKLIQDNGITVPNAEFGKDLTFMLPANIAPISYFSGMQSGVLNTLGERGYNYLEYSQMMPEMRSKFTNISNTDLLIAIRGANAEQRFYGPTYGPWY
jgi:hypothetical protein